jgi:anti-anti-sigma factor
MAGNFVGTYIRSSKNQGRTCIAPAEYEAGMIDWETEKAGRRGDVTVFRLTGRLESIESDYLLSAVEKYVRRDEIRVVLDCDRLEYISSLGLGMLVRARAKMKKAGGDMKLARVHGPIATVLSVVNLDRVFHLYPTVEAAVTSFAS